MALRGLGRVFRIQLQACAKVKDIGDFTVARATSSQLRLSNLQPEPQPPVLARYFFQSHSFAAGRQAALPGAASDKGKEPQLKAVEESSPAHHGLNDLNEVVGTLSGLGVYLATGSFMTGVGATIMYTIVSALVKDLAIIRLWPKMLLVVKSKNGTHRHAERAITFWLPKRSVRQVHAAAAAILGLRTEDTQMTVTGNGESVDLAYYLGEGSRWQLADYADAIVLTPSTITETAMHKEAAAAGMLEDGAVRDGAAGML